MLDPKRLRVETDYIESQLKRRGFLFDRERFADLETRRKQLQVSTEQLQAERNAGSKKLGQMKSQGQDFASLLIDLEVIKKKVEANASELETLHVEFEEFAANLPNLPDPSVPDGADETQNMEARRWGAIDKRSYEPRDHSDLGEAMGLLDFPAAAKMSGARFAVLRGPLARVQRALTQFMLDMHSLEHGYEELYVPYIVNGASLRGTGQLPKFAEDQFRLQTDQDWWLVPTAEVPVTNMLRDEIVPVEELPKKWVAHTPCFRAEAGSAGKDTRGLIRQHQFEKVELVQATEPGKSYKALEELTSHAEAVLRRLELPYRVMTLCTGDMGFGAAKTYDLEVWLPSQKRYREISSCSNYEDFQARRMLARYRTEPGAKPQLLHTLNGSGLAVGRTLVAILENYQERDGSVAIPSALQPYLGGMRRIS